MARASKFGPRGPNALGVGWKQEDIQDMLDRAEAADLRRQAALDRQKKIIDRLQRYHTFVVENSLMGDYEQWENSREEPV